MRSGVLLLLGSVKALSRFSPRAGVASYVSRGGNGSGFGNGNGGYLPSFLGMGFALMAAGPAAAHAEGPETAGMTTDPFSHTKLYPQAPLLEEGTLQVSKLHKISYTVFGNPNGKPCLFVHGGPGGGTDKAMARYFDPKKYKVVLVDQRGCGKSEPFAELDENSTFELIDDFEKIRKKLNIDKWMVFGGSWGSTLGLACK